MEREVLARGAMVLSILALVALILITPSLLGRPSPGLESVPLLVIGLSQNESAFILSVGAAVQAYRYDAILLTINGTQLWNGTRVPVNQTIVRYDNYTTQMWLPANATFTVHAYVVDDQQTYFEYNVTAHLEREASDQPVMVFAFPDEDNPSMEIRRFPPDDFRWLMPRRGALP